MAPGRRVLTQKGAEGTIVKSLPLCRGAVCYHQLRRILIFFYEYFIDRHSANRLSRKFVLRARYEGPLFSPSSSRSLLLSQSSYFWPLGVVAPSRDLSAALCCSVHPLAPLRSASSRKGPLRSSSRLWAV